MSPPNYNYLLRGSSRVASSYRANCAGMLVRMKTDLMNQRGSFELETCCTKQGFLSIWSELIEIVGCLRFSGVASVISVGSSSSEEA